MIWFRTSQASLVLVILRSYCLCECKRVFKSHGFAPAYVAPGLRVPCDSGIRRACTHQASQGNKAGPQSPGGSITSRLNAPQVCVVVNAAVTAAELRPHVPLLGHHVLVLVTQGLEDIAVDYLAERCGIPRDTMQVLPNARVALGVGAIGKIVVTLHDKEGYTQQLERLQQAAVAQAVLAFVAAAEGLNTTGGWSKDAEGDTKFGRAGLKPSGALAEVAELLETSPHWTAAFALLAASGLQSVCSFRASCASSGRARKGFDSEDVMRAMGGAALEAYGAHGQGEGWLVDLKKYDVELFGTLCDGHFACGLLLGGQWRRNANERKYKYGVIPFCEYRCRKHLEGSSTPWYMPRLRPSTALLLLLLAELQPGHSVIDPFGGSGGICIEAATQFEGTSCVTSDRDEMASRAAIRNVVQARPYLAAGSSLYVKDWDAQNLKEIEDSSIDCYVADLPFGNRCQWDSSSDLPKVLAEVRRVLNPSRGRCVLLMKGYVLLEKILTDLNAEACTSASDDAASKKLGSDRLLVVDERRTVGIGGFLSYAIVLQVKSLLQISKALSLILRHKAVQFGLRIRSDGFCVLNDVLSLPIMAELQATQTVVEHITRSNAKKRFEIRVIDGRYMIRALQGHSIKHVVDDDLLQKLELSDNLPAKCVHGTYSRHWPSILSKGLIAGGLEGGYRNHIHCAPYDFDDKRVISGMRTDCDIAIYIDLRKAMTAGIAFFMSNNQVILTKGKDGVLPSEYFSSAVNINTGEVLFPVKKGDRSK